jgi:multiple sugar transport system permease protein
MIGARQRGGRRDLVPVFFLLPLLLLVVFVQLGPATYTIYSSFFNWQLSRTDINFIGLQNYSDILQNVDFWLVVKNTLVWTIVSTFFHILLGMSLAVSLNKVKSRFMSIARILIILPYVTPGVVGGNLWRLILSGDYGFLNDILFRIGIIRQYISWLGEPQNAMPSVIIANIWKGVPFYMVLFYARLQSISVDLYEAAKIDGANFWSILGRITLPMMRPVMIMASILGFMWSFNYFDLIYSMTRGGPVLATETLPIYIYNRAFVFRDMSRATAVASFVLAVAIILIVIRIIWERKEEREYA